MKNRMVALTALVSALAGAGAIVASNAFAHTPPLTGNTKPEKHPELRKAVNQLKAAENTLRTAAWDFGGHKTDAMKDVQAAIAELHKAEKFDKK